MILPRRMGADGEFQRREWVEVKVAITISNAVTSQSKLQRKRRATAQRWNPESRHGSGTRNRARGRARAGKGKKRGYSRDILMDSWDDGITSELNK